MRPDLPRPWRFALGAIAFFLVAGVWGDLQLVAPLFLGIAGLSLAAMMAREPGATRWASIAGLAAVPLFFVLLRGPVGLFFGAGLGPALALLVVRRHVVLTPIALLAAATLVFVITRLNADTGPDSPELRAWGHAATAASATLAGALLAFALLARSAPTPPLSRAARLAIAGAGAALLALSWAAGGHWIFLPLWPLPLAALILPALFSWRALPAGALLVGGVALAGLAPVGTCTFDPWSDAIVPGVPPDADAYDDIVLLGQAGTHGPKWGVGGGFAGVAVECPAYVGMIGLAWDAALVGASTWAAWAPRRATPG